VSSVLRARCISARHPPLLGMAACGRSRLLFSTAAQPGRRWQRQNLAAAAAAGSFGLALWAAARCRGRGLSAKAVACEGDGFVPTFQEGGKYAYPRQHPYTGEPRRTLYPHIESFRTGRLTADSIHVLHFEECGNPNGKPVIFLHGGPGSGVKPNARRFFDPAKYRIILMDQRGSGKSTPHACLESNTTWHLVEDIELLRKHLGIERWVVFGGSWGSTLALAYAESHPERVKGLILRGIFMLRRKELLWFYQEGANQVFPEEWEPYEAEIPPAERGDFMAAYHRRLNSDDEAVRLSAAKAWSTWECSTSELFPDQDHAAEGSDPHFALAFSRIENHFFTHGGWFEPEDQLLRNVDRIRHIPTVMVQGRYDMVCPARSAWDLHKAFPEARLTVVPDCGHSGFEPGLLSELVKAADEFAEL
ncbi:unnamed protein product, partial [Polarella glacialis]